MASKNNEKPEKDKPETTEAPTNELGVNVNQAAGAHAASEAQAAAAATLREQIRQEEIAKLAERTADPEDDGVFAGQYAVSDHFTASTGDAQGRDVVEVKPAGWTGPGLIFHGSRVKELISLLKDLKNLPE